MSEPVQCSTCGLLRDPALSHGVADCIEELRHRAARAEREKIDALARASLAEEELGEMKAAMRRWVAAA